MKLSIVFCIICHLDIFFLLSGCSEFLPPPPLFIKLAFLLICKCLYVFQICIFCHMYVLQVTSPVLISRALQGCQSSAGLCPSAATLNQQILAGRKWHYLTSLWFCLLLSLGPSSPHFFFASSLVSLFFSFYLELIFDL